MMRSLACFAMLIAFLAGSAPAGATELYTNTMATTTTWLNGATWPQALSPSAPSDDNVVMTRTSSGFSDLISLDFTFGNTGTVVAAPVYPVTATYVFRITPAPSSWCTLRFALREDSGTVQYGVDFPMHAPGLLNVTEDGSITLTPAAVDISAAGLAPGDWARLTITMTQSEQITGSIARWNGSAYGTEVNFGPYSAQTPSGFLDGAHTWRAYITEFADSGVSALHEVDSVSVSDASGPVAPPLPRASLFSNTMNNAAEWSGGDAWMMGTDSTAPSTDDAVLSRTSSAFAEIVPFDFTFGNIGTVVPNPRYPVYATFGFRISPTPSSWCTLRMGFREDTNAYLYSVDFPMHAPGLLNVVEDASITLTPSAVDISAAGLVPGSWALLELQLNANETIQGTIRKWNGTAYGTPVAFGPFNPSTPSGALGGANAWRPHVAEFADSGVSVSHEIDFVGVEDTLPNAARHWTMME